MELYKEPKMIYTCVYLGDEMQFIIRYRKLVPIDIGTNLLSIVPTLQRVLGLYQEPFVIGYTDIIGKNEEIKDLRWLHYATVLQDQNVNDDGILLCHPISKLLKVLFFLYFYIYI